MNSIARIEVKIVFVQNVSLPSSHYDGKKLVNNNTINAKNNDEEDFVKKRRRKTENKTVKCTLKNHIHREK